MDQSDSDAFKTRLGDLIHHGFDLGTVDVDQYLSVGIHAARNGKAHLTRQQWLGQVQVQIVLLKPRLGAHFNDIAKARCGDQRSFGTAPFNQSICSQGGTVDDLADLGRINPRLRANLMHPVDDRIFWGGVSGQHFG